MLLRLALAAAVLLMPWLARAQQSGTEALIDQVIEAHGGWNALSAVSGYRMEGTVLTTHQKPPAPTTRVVSRPDRLKVVIQYTDKREVRILDGAKGWRTDGQGVLGPAEGPLLDSMVLQRARALLPWILRERRTEVKGIAALRESERQLAGLELPLGPGLTLRAYVDPASHRVVRSVTLLERAGLATSFEARFSTFSSVEGLVFALREENYAGGAHAASTSFHKVTLNPDLREDEFVR